MTVGVRVDRKSGSIIDVLGKPQFRLMEIQDIPETRAANYRPGGQREFDAADWQRIVRAKGDFGAIGVQLNHGNPLPGFKRYMAFPRNGIRMVPSGEKVDVPSTR
jgi:hypothetical protein